MDLIRLMYTSESAVPFGHTDLAELATKSQANNVRNGVTGFLVYASPHFTQALEGDRTAVMWVFGRISADRRHRHIKLLSIREIDAVEFADWSMRLIHVDEPLAEVAGPICRRHRVSDAGRLAEADEGSMIGCIRELASAMGRLMRPPEA